jgi:hypothetical protein
VSHADTTVVIHGDPGLRRFGRVLRAVGLVGVFAGGLAIALCLWLLHDVDVMVGRSLTLTAESLGTVDASLEVATDSVATIGDGLAQAERTSRGLEDSLTDGADLLDETARLLRGDVASSLESVKRSMPALVQVGGTIDTTLRAVDQLPVGPSYDPDEPFGETLAALRDDLQDLPRDLRSQADTVDEASDNLRVVGQQGERIAVSMTDVRTSLDDASAVLGEYRTTAGDARDLIDETTADLGRRLVVLRVLVVVLGLIYCVGQTLPLYLGHRLAEARIGPQPVPHEPRVEAEMSGSA